MENKVCIKIKSPSAQYQDLELTCDIENTVIQVKKRISEEFPTKPSVTGQKLVYSGKILKDLDKLSDILRFEDEVTKFTFHLVCAVPQKKSSVTEENTSSFPDGLRHRSSGGLSTSPSFSGGQPQDQMMDQMMREFSNQYSEAMASMSNNPSDSEMAAMQQLYNQYLSVYMQYMQSQALVTGQQYQFMQPAANNQVNLQQDVADHHPEAGPGPVPEAAVPNNPGLVMNAGAAAGQIQDVGGDRQRDLLDWVYVMTRVVLLISVIYFHSSFLRLAFVAGLGFLVYLYQNRIRQRQQQQQAVQQQQQQREQAAQQQQQQRTNSEDGAGDNENAPDEETEDEVIIEPPAPGKFAVLITFFTSLVSSIIPEQPQVI